MEMWTFLYSFYVTIRIRLNRTFVGQWPSKLYPFFKRYRFLVFMCASKLRMFDIFGICISKKLFFITLLSELPGVDQVIRSYSRRKSIYKFGLSVCLFVSNKRQKGWTDRAQIFCGTSRDQKEGLWMIKKIVI